MKRLNNLLLVAFLPLAALLFGPAASSQQIARGTPAFGSFSGGLDIINNGNLNVHLTIPVLRKPGRGMAFSYGIGYDSSVWYPVGTSGNQTWQLVANAGWFLYAPVTTGMIQYSVNQFTLPCNPPSNLTQVTVYQYSNWSFTDLAGTRHLFSVTEYSYPGGCPYISQQYPTTSATQVAPDGSGYTLTATGSTGSVWDSRGTLTSTSSANITDRNGNYISNTGSTFTDTLGATALSVSGSGTPASPLVFTYTPPAGGSPTYQMKYTSYPIQTNFGCSGITDYGTNGTTTANLVSEIDLPDNTKYSFNYEPTPQKSGFITGRIQSITLPAGGSITYTYTGGSSGNINCSDGTTIGLQRAVSDGVSSNTWTYVRTQGSGNQWTTLITTPIDPANSGVGNDTVIIFQKDSATSSTYNFYPTQRTSYQGSQSGNIVLQTVTSCYNTNAANCTTTAVSSPITQTNAITSLPVPGAGTVQSERINKYDSYGNSTEVDEYAFGSGAPPSTPYRKTTITYASFSTIHALRQQVSTYNSSGTLTSQTNYNYDETAPVAAPTGTPHLSSISGSRGNLTSIQRCTVLSSCGANYVKTIMTYDTAGQLQSVNIRCCWTHRQSASSGRHSCFYLLRCCCFRKRRYISATLLLGNVRPRISGSCRG
jgi:hypothetical protein